MSNYKALQKQASDLGLKSVGVSQEDLKKNIQEKLAETSPKTSHPKEDYNLAIINDGTREVRRYSLVQHGQDFVDLARQFAQNRGYQVNLAKAKEGVICPSCGHQFISR